MFPNNPINEDHRIQSLNLRFNFAPEEEGELPVHVTFLGDNTQYFGKFAYDPHLTFNQIRARLQEGNFMILTKNQDIFNITIQEVQAEFLSMSQLKVNDLKNVNAESIEEIKEMLETLEIRITNKMRDEIEKLEINPLKETVRRMGNNQTDFDRVLQTHSEEFYKIKKEVENFQINQLKIGINECVQRQEEFRMIVQSQNDSVEDLKDSMEKYKLELKKTIEEVKKINEESLKNEIKKLQNEIKNVKYQNKTITEAIKEFEDKISRHEVKINKNEADFKNKMKEISEDSHKKIKPIEKIYDLKESRNLQNQKYEMKPNRNHFSNESEKELKANEFQWSEELKSKGIRIDGNVVTKTNQTCEWHFCLLNASFEKNLKIKESWAIKINTKTDSIGLGVCLKSKMIEYNFNDQNIKWYETGHGLYLVSSSGSWFSHSEKEFNNLMKSFEFGSGDVIFVDYDPIESNLRFSKNKVKYFEMPIIAPPLNDAYHPYVLLSGKNNSVKLVHPFIDYVSNERNNFKKY